MKSRYQKYFQVDYARLNSRADEAKYVRELAAEVVSIAREPRMTAIKQRWCDVNGLHRPDHSPVWCNPVGLWKELLPDSSLRCNDPLLRDLELTFKKLLFKRDIDDDTPVNDYFKSTMIFDVIPENVWGVDIVKESLETEGSAWQYKSALQTPADFDRLRVPEYRYNPRKTAAAAAQLEEILSGVMPVRIVPFQGYFSIATICSAAANLRGMEQMMMDMILEPELVHRLMNVIYAGAMRFLDAVESAGGIVPNNDEAMFQSDPPRPGVNGGEYSLKDCWIAGNSQELDQVSPAMFEEFLLDYQKKIFARFGAVSYGCCENLTNKMEPVLAIPNLKIMVCSAWTNLDKLIARVGTKHCIMWRHKASDAVCPHDISALKQYVNEGARKLQGHYYQTILRELQTQMGHDNRLYEWTQISKEATTKYA
ncbi:MAG: hypothetical protein WCV67_01815 [Victivallaceae bacterium]|jgi:hypothetical protein